MFAFLVSENLKVSCGFLLTDKAIDWYVNMVNSGLTLSLINVYMDILKVEQLDQTEDD